MINVNEGETPDKSHKPKSIRIKKTDRLQNKPFVYKMHTTL
jgi:hypothetical protein